MMRSTGRMALLCGVCAEPVTRADLAVFRPLQAGEGAVPVLITHKDCTRSEACARLVPTYRSLTIDTMLQHLMLDMA